MWCVSDRAECASPCLSLSVFLPLQPVCLGEATGWPGCGGGEGGGVCLRPHGVTLAPTADTLPPLMRLTHYNLHLHLLSLTECVRVCR
ncbi:hypothetical protein Pmani_039520 [Petrolisthes manimaculis]|uniref:Secreted protein n=1 Tax=Petrolisthes manimaculis TaxID=1843537 RepID=A0AAE1TL95_9EUCA|nr:hypothetical protein Pmani_039520 [Petrolisthes manimaculis]